MAQPPDHPNIEMVREMWVNRKPRPKPARLDDWRALAVDVRKERCGHPIQRVAVAGNVTHTGLERGSVIPKRIHRYEESGEDYRKMVAAIMHPDGLAGPRHCERGQSFADCHLAEVLANACHSNSGVPLGQCCWRPKGEPRG